MFSVYQHWDPLKVCVVGRSYPPEFYSWITVPHVRELFERIAIETEEDFQNIIKKLQQFDVEILRPELQTNIMVNGKHIPPPMTPRDYMVMIGETFYTNSRFDFSEFYANVKDSTWPSCSSYQEFLTLPEPIQSECNTIHNLKQHMDNSSYEKIYNFVEQQSNIVKFHSTANINGAMVSRIGRDLFFGTAFDTVKDVSLQNLLDAEFKTTRNHVINTAGHSDGTFCAVCPGLIISLFDIPTYTDTFPDWEVIYLPNQSWNKVQPFLDLKEKNAGRWWIPGFEHDQDVINIVETWLKHWTGYVEETVFDVNMLMIDPKNVMVFNYNKTVFDALERYGITPHIVPFRHRYFWDGGIHCVTTDLHREGAMQNYFPQRG